MINKNHLIHRLIPSVCIATLFCSTLAGQSEYSQSVEQTESMVYGETNPKTLPATKQQADFSKGPQPNWIWIGNGAPDDNFLFKKEFQNSGFRRASLIVSCDNAWRVDINGKKVTSGSTWKTPSRSDITKLLKPGQNSLIINGKNDSDGSAAGLIAKIRLEKSDGTVEWVITDSTWEFSPTSKTPTWKKGVTVLAKLGGGPWGNIFNNDSTALSGSTPRNVFNVRKGFKVEKIFTVPKAELGSWVSICVDYKGRLLASDQGGKGISRITPAALDGSTKTTVEKLDLNVSGAQGMLYAFESLYLSVNGGPGSGLYRARDTNGDDQFDELNKLKVFRGGGEHGPHALRLSPDGKSIYVIAGNHTAPPQDLNWSRIAPNWGEDHLLPRQWDARGHARGKLAPGGWIAKTDPDGKRWELVSMGYRNPYDMDFNADGELFAYDADMEWDMGSPWYRPTRVVHATSGSEFGWRSGTGKWPTYYADSLPPICDIGPGSPVGAAFGYGAKFPAKYQKAFFICDWTFGTMYAIHLTPQGGSYVGKKEEFVSRSPLPLTDVAVGLDGALYFTIGGRGTDSEIYRVVYEGSDSTTPIKGNDSEHAADRNLRKLAEKSHLKNSNVEAAKLISLLSHGDRYIRYAARVGIERKPISDWLDLAMQIKDANGRIHAMLALARQGDAENYDSFLNVMQAIDFGGLSKSEKLAYLRTLSVGFIRLSQPDAKTKKDFADKLDPVFPSQSDSLNRELSRVLVYLDSPKVIETTLNIMRNPPPQDPEILTDLLARNAGYGGTIAKMLSNLPEIQNIHYASMLRNLRYGWTLEQRREYFEILNKLLAKSGGASYQGFIQNIRKDAMANLSDAEKTALASTEIAPPIQAVELPKPMGPGVQWTLNSAMKAVGNRATTETKFEAGQRAYAAAKCIICHRFDGKGGATGPDLTNVSGRFNRRDLLESIINPNKVISDQYRAQIIQTADGKLVTGRIISETDESILVATDPEDATKTVTIRRDNIEGQKAAPQSLMPSGLMDELNRQEVVDLITFLLSRGNPSDPAYQKP